MAVAIGLETATQLDMMAQVYAHMLVADAENSEARTEYQSTIDQITAAMGNEFTALYERSLHEKHAAEYAEQARSLERAGELRARSEAGLPWVYGQEVTEFLQQGGADQVLASLNPEVLAGLEEALTQVDLDSLPDDDIGKQLVSALRAIKKK